ncbi:MAG: sugar phosphate nucleotidyltransferase [Candidatus Hadarchaeota archaeon]
MNEDKMKALVLAGGYATRLWPITKNRAKPLLPLNGKPILSYILDEVEEISDIDNIILATNERFEESFEEYISGREGNYELVIEKQDSEEEKYGAIGGMINVIENREKDDYLIIGGDNYYSFKIQDFLDCCDKKGSIVNACFKLSDPEEAQNYGIVQFDEDQKIIQFQEKPENPSTLMASTACYYFTQERLSAFDDYVEYWKGRIPEEKYLDEPGRFLEWIVEEFEAYAYPFEGKWVDIGTRAGYLRAESEIGDEETLLGRIKESDMEGTVTVLEGSVVENSKIENSIIFENCTIKDSIVKNSLIGEGTELIGTDIREGLIEDIE